MFKSLCCGNRIIAVYLLLRSTAGQHSLAAQLCTFCFRNIVAHPSRIHMFVFMFEKRKRCLSSNTMVGKLAVVMVHFGLYWVGLTEV